MSKNNSFIVPVLFGFAIIVAIFGIRPLYTTYMDSKTAETSALANKADREKTLTALENLQKSFSSASGSTELTTKVKKVSSPWDEAAVMSAVMLNDYTKSAEFTPASVTIGSVSLDKGKKLPSGLSLGTVNMSISAPGVDKVIDFLTYLTSNAPYVFTLDAIDLPISAPVQKDANGVNLSVTLGVYYYE